MPPMFALIPHRMKTGVCQLGFLFRVAGLRCRWLFLSFALHVGPELRVIYSLGERLPTALMVEALGAAWACGRCVLSPYTMSVRCVQRSARPPLRVLGSPTDYGPEAGFVLAQ